MRLAVVYRAPVRSRLRLWLAAVLGRYRRAELTTEAIEALGYEHDGVLHFTCIRAAAGVDPRRWRHMARRPDY